MSVFGRLLDRLRPKGGTAAPLNDFLLLVSGRPDSVRAGRLRASATIGRHPVAIREVSEGDAQDAPRVVQLGELLNELVPRLSRDQRAELFEFVRSTVQQDLDEQGHFTLAKSLFTLRERLREQLPLLSFDKSAPQTVVIDAILAVDERSFWFSGWSRDADGTLTRLELVSPEGQHAELLEGAYRFARPDVEQSLAAAGIHSQQKHGFAKLVELPAPSPLADGWLGELRRPSGAAFQVPTPTVTRDTSMARAQILSELAAEPRESEELKREHGYPALTRLQAHIGKSIEVESTVQYGEPPASPKVSIVVPLYQRIDLVEHQIANIWQDPEIAASELIFVLDSPELAELLGRIAAGLHDLYGLPFKVVNLSRNAGYSTANNIGASLARGRLLLLLNSDVLPAQPGWLGRMSAFYDATPEIGALGPKLLFEDDSIQHAGMYFQRDPGTRRWDNQHYFKGFNRSLAAANVNQPVPAVTGACLMIERALYEQLGGLRDIFVQGGYEDSDLCLRLIDAGRRNWYLADVELYHLEAQSFPITARPANQYNLWLQDHLWGDRIEELMRRDAPTADHDVAIVS
jgi:GT2 family glycosyltransferase